MSLLDSLIKFSTAALAIERHHLGRTPFLAPDIGHKYAVAASQAIERVRSDPGYSHLLRLVTIGQGRPITAIFTESAPVTYDTVNMGGVLGV